MADTAHPHLDSKQVARAMLPRQVHSAKGASADGLDDVKLLDTHALLCQHVSVCTQR